MRNSVNRFAIDKLRRGQKCFFSVVGTQSRLAGSTHVSSYSAFSRGRGLSSSSSLRSKVIQGHLPLCFVSTRSYSSGNQCFPQGSTKSAAEKAGKMDNGDVENLGKNEAWNATTCEVYKTLVRELTQQGNGDWCEHETHIYHGERRLFTKAAVSELPGKFFEYKFFFSKKEQRVKGVIQFGPYTQGPPGCVHGGASASMMDSAIGVCVNKCFSFCVTASLTTNYKSLLPLGTTALVESWIDKVEGRKIFAKAELKSPDGKLTYVTANALFIQLDPEAKSKDVKEKKEMVP